MKKIYNLKARFPYENELQADIKAWFQDQTEDLYWKAWQEHHMEVPMLGCSCFQKILSQKILSQKRGKEINGLPHLLLWVALLIVNN